MTARLLAITVLALAATDSPAVFPVLVIAPRLDSDGVPLPPEAIRRLGPARSVADGSVAAAAFTSDGRHIVTAGDGIALRLAADASVVWRKPVAKFSSAAITIAASGRTAWVMGFSYRDPKTPQYEIVHVSLDDGAVLTRRSVDSRWAWTHSITAAGRFVTLTQDLGQARVFDAEAEAPILEWATAGLGVPPGAALSPDGKLLAVCASKPRAAADPPQFALQIVDLATRTQKCEIPEQGVGDLRFSGDGKTLFALCEPMQWAGPRRPPCTLLLIDPAVGTVRTSFALRAGRYPNGPRHLWPAADGSAVAVSGYGNWPLSVFDMATGELRFRIPSAGYGSAAFSPDGRVLAVGGFNLSLWDARTGRRLPASPPTERGYFRLAFAADGRTLTGFPGELGDVTSWDLRTGRELERLSWDKADRRGLVPQSMWHNEGLPRMARSNTGLVARTLWVEDDAGHDDNGRVVVREERTGREIASVPKAGSGEELHLTLDGRYLLSRFNATVQVWDVTTGKLAYRLPGHPACNGIGGSRMSGWVYPSPTGRHVAAHELNAYDAHGQWSVGVYELTGGAEFRRFEGTGLLQTLTWSADGARLAGIGYSLKGEQGFAFVGSLSANTPPYPQTPLPGPCGRGAIAISADGKSLAFSPDGRIHLWDVAAGAVRHTFPGHPEPALALAFSPDGRTLASAGAGGPVILWDVAGELSRPAAAVLDRVWADLAGEPVRAFRAERLLTAHPETGLPFLKRRFAAEPVPDPAAIARLVARLDATNFTDRQTATAELKALGDAARPALRKVVAESSSTEARARAGELLAASHEIGPGRLRIVRAVEAVERVGTPTAATPIRVWARSPNAPLADEAAAALRRRGW